MNDLSTKKVVALQEYRVELHAIRMRTADLLDRAFAEAEARVARLERLAHTSPKTRAALDHESNAA